MNKFCISCLLAALLFVVPLAVFIAPDMGRLENEGRWRAAFPAMPSRLRYSDIIRFFRRFDAFFTDHFPLRASLLAPSIALHEAVGGNLNIDQCYRGKENWLFLGNSHGRCVDKLQGRVILAGDNLKRQTEVYGKIRDAAESCGAEFFIFIGPNKSSIYPEYLPPVVAPAQRRFISPLLDAINEAGIQVYDPTALLIGAKSTGLLYYRTDTHWNLRGAYEAFAGFREYAGLPALPPLSITAAAPVAFHDLARMGGYTNFPVSTGDNFTLTWSAPLTLHEEGGLITNTHATSNKTAWVFGDSFVGALRPYITATFKEVRFFGHDAFEAAVASQNPKPDIMLWIIVERNFAR